MSMFDNLSKQLSECASPGNLCLNAPEADCYPNVSRVTVYDIKSYYNQAKNIVMNYTEMESKVREATNNDPWGASSSLMEEIAIATKNFQLFNEIMPTIYKRFTEKEASEWRQIYKALQLLEYLIKNGSERVIDDARSHISIIKILRSFHFIDEKAKDQGINVRNRAKELAELLSDSDRIRQERRKAKVNKQKYKGIEGGSGYGGFSSSSSSRYGGFGSESAGVGGGYGEDSPSDFYRTSQAGSSTARRDSFEEYDAGDDDDRQPSQPTSSQTKSSSNKPVPAAPKQKEVNLFDFDEEEPTPAPVSKVAASSAPGLDDDFDDFQSATPAAAAAAAPVPSAASPTPAAAPTNMATAKPSFFDLVNAPSTSSPAPQPPVAAPRPAMQGTNSFASASSGASGFGLASPANSKPATPAAFSPMAPASASSSNPAATSKPANAFDDIWSMAGGSSAASKPAAGKSMAELNKQKSDAQIWSNPGSNSANSGGDLLF